MKLINCTVLVHVHQNLKFAYLGSEPLVPFSLLLLPFHLLCIFDSHLKTVKRVNDLLRAAQLVISQREP